MESVRKLFVCIFKCVIESSCPLKAEYERGYRLLALGGLQKLTLPVLKAICVLMKNRGEDQKLIDKLDKYGKEKLVSDMTTLYRNTKEVRYLK